MWRSKLSNEKMRKLFISFAVCLLVLPALIFAVWVAVVDSRFDDYSATASFYDGCNKVWAHRGYVEKGLQRNSLASVEIGRASCRERG